MSAGVSQDKYQQTVNVGLQGGVVAHANGITLSQPLGDTIALVKAPGTHGTHITNQTGVETDFRGYTVVPFVTAYRHNTIALDTETLPDNADVTHAAQIVTPTRGAVVRASFNTRVGNRVLMTLTQRVNRCPSAQRSPPRIRTANLLSAMTARPTSLVCRSKGISTFPGTGANEHCVADYALTDEKEKTSIINAAAQCH